MRPQVLMEVGYAFLLFGRFWDIRGIRDLGPDERMTWRAEIADRYDTGPELHRKLLGVVWFSARRLSLS